MTGVPQGAGHIHWTAVIGEPAEARETILSHHKRGVDGLEPLVDKTARIGALVTVNSGTAFRTLVGPHVWLMNGVHVAHDCIIEDNVEISCNSAIGGWVHIKKGAKLGLNCTVRPHIVIGENAVIGAGSVVTKNVPAGETWVGNPAHKLVKDNGDKDLTDMELWGNWWVESRKSKVTG